MVPISVLNDFLGLFYPSYCMGCLSALSKGEEVLCTNCLTDLPKTNYHRYVDNPVYNKLSGRLPIQFGCAFLKFRKGGIVQQLLHELKYNDHPEIGVRLGQAFGYDLRQSGFQNEFDLIIPVPLHISRRRQRGYNQSAQFADGLGQAMNVAFNDQISMRKSATQTQTRKSRAERWQNVSDRFEVGQPDMVDNKRILLVDDVITTGATLEACGRHLLECGCRTLSIACIADAL